MKTATKVVLGLTAGAVVAGGVLYVLGKKKLAVTDPKAAESATVGQTIGAAWTMVIGTTTPAPRASASTPGEDNVDRMGEIIANNIHSEPTQAQLATSGLYRVTKG